MRLIGVLSFNNALYSTVHPNVFSISISRERFYLNVLRKSLYPLILMFSSLLIDLTSCVYRAKDLADCTEGEFTRIRKLAF